MTYKLAAVAVLALAVAGSARAASNQGAADEDNGSRTFAGLHFGVALSVTHDLDDNRVEEAIIEYELENGTAIPKVRVTKTNNTRARLMLETHYFFLPDKVRSAVEVYEASGRKGPSPSLHGWGPFVALQPGSEEIVEALGAGIMWGWRKSVESNRSFNLAFG